MLFSRFILVALLLLTSAVQCGPRPEAASDITPTPSPTATTTPAIGVTLATLMPATAVVLQTTPTPLPTATPTPTATPIVYLIAPGDTLLAIAIARSTTVDEIKEMNPGIRPELLQIGQAIQLPPPATPMFQAAVSTPVPMEVVVASVTAYQTAWDTVWLLGEVINEGAEPVENVQVEVTVHDEAGLPLTTTPAWVSPAVLLPGQRGPFAVLLLQTAGNLQVPLTAVVGGQTLLDFGSRYLDLAVGAGEITIEEGRVSLAGWVENQGEATAVQLLLVATFYDTNGRVSGYRELLLPGPLAPGEAVAFALDVAPPGGPVVGYQFLVQGLRQVK
jgi:LysM repeat protein